MTIGIVTIGIGLESSNPFGMTTLSRIKSLCSLSLIPVPNCARVALDLGIILGVNLHRLSTEQITRNRRGSRLHVTPHHKGNCDIWNNDNNDVTLIWTLFCVTPRQTQVQVRG